MTNNQLQYNLNAKRCRRLGQMLEHYIEWADFNEKELNAYSHEIAEYEVQQIREELDSLYDDQVELFFAIRDEFTRIKKQIFVETIRPVKGITTKVSSKIDY